MCFYVLLCASMCSRDSVNYAFIVSMSTYLMVKFVVVIDHNSQDSIRLSSFFTFPSLPIILMCLAWNISIPLGILVGERNTKRPSRTPLIDNMRFSRYNVPELVH